MLTREQIEEIQTESREKGISVKNPLKEKGKTASYFAKVKARWNTLRVAYLELKHTM